MNTVKRILLSLSLCAALAANAQQPAVVEIDANTYQNQKESGTLDQTKKFKIFGTGANSNNTVNITPQPIEKNSLSACGCFLPIDNTFSIVPFTNGNAPEYRNDDGSTNEIQLPFTFCLYGDNYNSVFINNNGNVSFGASYATFSASAFPTNDFVMVAPFWADVDTRNLTSGLVYFKITPTALIVRWQNVGYFSSQADKINDFQLVITDGIDPLLPPGSNVSFCYGDMQWTTGSASNGVNGFGGTPATVGANRGNGSDYVQFGRFDQAGSTYDGPFGNSDGISWLDNQSFFFNSCVFSSNIAPITSGVTTCDTVDVCVGEVVPLNFSFLAPEQTQINTVTFTTDAPDGVVITPTNGNTAIVNGSFTGTNANLGFNNVTITATDNGVPNLATQVILVFNVQPGPPIPTVAQTAPVCPGGNVTLSVTNGPYLNYTWNPGGSTSSSLVVTQPGTYTVTVDSGGCDVASIPLTVNFLPVPDASITGPNATCSQGVATLVADTTGDITGVEWSPGGQTTPSVNVPPGTYSVEVTNSFGCTDTAQFTVANADPLVTITGDTFTCFNAPVALTANVTPVGNNYSYTWSPNVGNTQTVNVQSGEFVVTVADPSGLCTDVDTFQIDNITPTVTINGNVLFCEGDTIQLTSSTQANNYQWFSNGVAIPSGNDDNLAVSDSAQYILVITDAFGCSISDTVLVDPAELPTAAFVTNPPTGAVEDIDISFIDQSVPGTFPLTNWSWSFEDGIPFNVSTDQNPSNIQFDNPGSPTVTLIITDSIGCQDTITIDIPVLPKFVPNVFTPDGNNLNDFLVITQAEVLDNCKLWVFNRWGTVVYKTENYQNDWDGGNNSEGTYFYILEQPNGDRYTGNITILRSN